MDARQSIYIFYSGTEKYSKLTFLIAGGFMMNKKLTRRFVVKNGLIAGTLVSTFSVIGYTASAAALPMLDPSDPTASALGFVPDAAKVNVGANPTFKPGQHCGTCAQFQGRPGDASGGCNIFTGHSVPATGWCKVWAAKPA